MSVAFFNGNGRGIETLIGTGRPQGFVPRKLGSALHLVGSLFIFSFASFKVKIAILSC